MDLNSGRVALQFQSQEDTQKTQWKLRYDDNKESAGTRAGGERVTGRREQVGETVEGQCGQSREREMSSEGKEKPRYIYMHKH